MNIIAFWLTVLYLVIALSESRAEHFTSEVQTKAALQNTFYNDVGDERYTYERGLKKRAIARANAAKKGLNVMEKLLTGAKKVKTTKNVNFYQKDGDRRTALNDFNSVQPVVTRPNMINLGLGRRPLGELLIGRVGDRRLVLMLDGDPYQRSRRRHSPVLEIRSATENRHYVIVYKMKK